MTTTTTTNNALPTKDIYVHNSSWNRSIPFLVKALEITTEEIPFWKVRLKIDGYVDPVLCWLKNIQQAIVLSTQDVIVLNHRPETYVGIDFATNRPMFDMVWFVNVYFTCVDDRDPTTQQVDRLNYMCGLYSKWMNDQLKELNDNLLRCAFKGITV